MIVKWKSEYIGHVGFEVTPEDYDGIPRFSHYWLDAAPKNRHADREALAAFLIYGSYMGGLTQMPHKFSPALESAFRRISGVPSSFAPVELYPKALPLGARSLMLSWADDGLFTQHGMSSPHAYLHIDRSDMSSGSMRSIHGLRVASNAWMHSRSDRGNLEHVFPFLAAGVLFAEDLEADKVLIRGTYDVESAGWANLVHLFGAARLGIECLP